MKKHVEVWIGMVVVGLCACGTYGAVGDGWPLTREQAQARSRLKTAETRTARLHDAKWGVFNHFLAYDCRTPEEWNRKVEGLDVDRMAEALASCGAKFCVFTLMQQTRYLCAPNATYDRIAGVKAGEACSRRDLVADLAEALGKRGIDLHLHATGVGPCRDAEVTGRFGYTGGKVSRAFVEKWASVLEEYAVRYGERVKGWWIDACYRGGLEYDDGLAELYARAIWNGNAKALVTLGDGRKPAFARAFACEDFTFAEFDDLEILPTGRFTDYSQNMVLGPIAKGWFQKGLLHDGAYLADYVDLVNRRDGVATIDVLLHPDGTFEPDHLEALRAVGRKTGTLGQR